MQYKDLNNNKIKWHPKSAPRENASKNHKNAIELIRRLCPNTPIYEECCLPLGISKSLYLDIYLPHYNLAIEVDGRQHDSYNYFFFDSKAAFRESQKNDKLKEEWCQINNITFVRLKETKNHDQWASTLAAAIA